MNHKELMSIIKEAASKLADELEVNFPGLTSQKYNFDSLGSCNGPDFINRMVFGIYLELVKADRLNDIKAE